MKTLEWVRKEHFWKAELKYKPLGKDTCCSTGKSSTFRTRHQQYKSDNPWNNVSATSFLSYLFTEATGAVWAVFSSSPWELLNSESWNRFPIFGRFRWLLRVRVETGVFSGPEGKPGNGTDYAWEGLPMKTHRNARTTPANPPTAHCTVFLLPSAPAKKTMSAFVFIVSICFHRKITANIHSFYVILRVSTFMFSPTDFGEQYGHYDPYVTGKGGGGATATPCSHTIVKSGSGAWESKARTFTKRTADFLTFRSASKGIF